MNARVQAIACCRRGRTGERIVGPFAALAPCLVACRRMLFVAACGGRTVGGLGTDRLRNSDCSASHGGHSAHAGRRQCSATRNRARRSSRSGGQWRDRRYRNPRRPSQLDQHQAPRTRDRRSDQRGRHRQAPRSVDRRIDRAPAGPRRATRQRPRPDTSRFAAFRPISPRPCSTAASRRAPATTAPSSSTNIRPSCCRASSSTRRPTRTSPASALPAPPTCAPFARSSSASARSRSTCAARRLASISSTRTWARMAGAARQATSIN